MPSAVTNARITVVAGLALIVGPLLTASSGDWLLPAELFPFVLVGGALVTWAAPGGSANRRLGGIGLLLSAGSLMAGTLVSALLGLVTPGRGWETAVGIAVLAGYALGVVIMLATGWFVARDAFARREPSGE